MNGSGTKERLNRFVEAARQSGVKLTHQRLEIFRELAAANGHPDVDTIFRRVRRRIPTISPDTVYRAFALLERENALSKVSLFSDKARYDSNTEKHHHFVCVRCGLVQDFYSEEYGKVEILPQVAGLGDVDSVYVELRGVCNDCKRE